MLFVACQIELTD